jgi:starch synthase (maltosyl-transferring)
VNTPDILTEYLVRGGRPAFRVRLALAATLSPLYGMYSGYELIENVPLREGSEEYLHSEKYEIKVRDWNARGNISAETALLNRIRRETPALQRFSNVTFHASENEQILFYRKEGGPLPAAVPSDRSRTAAPRKRSSADPDMLVAVNLDPKNAQATMVHVPIAAMGIGPEEPYVVHDLLTDRRFTWRGARNYVRLDPSDQVAHVLRVER